MFIQHPLKINYILIEATILRQFLTFFNILDSEPDSDLHLSLFGGIGNNRRVAGRVFDLHPEIGFRNVPNLIISCLPQFSHASSKRRSRRISSSVTLALSLEGSVKASFPEFIYKTCCFSVILAKSYKTFSFHKIYVGKPVNCAIIFHRGKTFLKLPLIATCTVFLFSLSPTISIDSGI